MNSPQMSSQIRFLPLTTPQCSHLYSFIFVSSSSCTEEGCTGSECLLVEGVEEGAEGCGGSQEEVEGVAMVPAGGFTPGPR